jgi:hypothetical protein
MGGTPVAPVPDESNAPGIARGAGRLAARGLLKKFKKNLRDPTYQNRDWVLRLREAAEEGDS